MDTKSTFTPKPYNYGPLANYTVTWYDGTTTDLKVHNIDHPTRNIDIHDRSYGTARHVRFFASLDGRWTMVLSAPEHNIRKIEFTSYDPEDVLEKVTETSPEPVDTDPESTDEPVEGPDLRDNAIPADEITKVSDDGSKVGADFDEREPLMPPSLHTLETIENGEVTFRDTYAF